MVDMRISGVQFTFRYAKHLSRSFDERDPASGAGATHRVEVHSGAPAAAGDCGAEDRIVVFRIVGSERDGHVLPRRLKLLGDKLRHGARDVLAHIGLADGDRHFAVMANCVPDARLEIGGWSCQSILDLGQGDVAEYESGGGGSDKEAAPVDVRQNVNLLMLCHGLDSPHVGGGAHDGALDTRIGHATAEIAVHVRDDFGLGGIGVFGEQRSGLHDLPGLAVAALRDLLGDPRALQRVLTLGIETFDCGDLFASGGRYGGLAGAHRLTVDVDSTGATQTGAATELRAGHL